MSIIVLQHSKPIVRLFIKTPKLVHMLTNVLWTILDMEPLEILPWSALAALAVQGTISGGSISRIVRNTLFYICTNFGAFMQIWTIGLLCCSTINSLAHACHGEHFCEVSPRSVQLFWRRRFFICFRVNPIWLPNHVTYDVICVNLLFLMGRWSYV